jgi:hypothetical protein
MQPAADMPILSASSAFTTYRRPATHCPTVVIRSVLVGGALREGAHLSCSLALAQAFERCR